MEIGIEPKFLEDLSFRVNTLPCVASRVLRLVEETQRDPFRGTGKPEPLRFLGTGIWSRRITDEHRLVYRIDAARVIFLQGRYYY